MAGLVETALTEEPLDIAAAVARVSTPEAGGIALFVGTVRASAAAPGREGSPVVRLEYEAHPTLAEERLAEIAAEGAARWDLHRIVAVHRTGACDLGEPTVVVACSSAHRADALEACRWTIDELKARVPIWKREVFADGSAWIGAEGSEEELTST